MLFSVRREESMEMKCRIALNPDKEIVDFVRNGLAKNDGFCPCEIERAQDNKCPCVKLKKE